jgi:hypothetical protein
MRIDGKHLTEFDTLDGGVSGIDLNFFQKAGRTDGQKYNVEWQQYGLAWSFWTWQRVSLYDVQPVSLFLFSRHMLCLSLSFQTVQIES